MEFLASRNDAPGFAVRELDVNLCNPQPERIYQIYDPNLRYNADKKGVIGHIVIADTTLSSEGMAKGGTAMYPGCDLAITNAKAHVMAKKQIPCHPLGKRRTYTPWGGAKSGIDFDSFRNGTREAELVWRGFVQAAWRANIVPNEYIFGLDVGLNEHAARIAVDQVGSPLVITGKPRELGGAAYDEEGFAGRGAVIVAEHMFAHRGFLFADKNTTIVINGFGAVGQGIARGILDTQSAWKLPSGGRSRVIAVADASRDGNTLFTIYDPEGLDLKRLIAIKRKGGEIADYVPQDKNACMIPPESELLECDALFLASSKTETITAENANLLRCKFIIQGANLGVTKDALPILRSRAILTLPDYMTNYASAASVYVEHALCGTKEIDVPKRAWAYVERLMHHNTDFVLRIMKKSGADPQTVCDIICAYEFQKAIVQARKK